MRCRSSARPSGWTPCSERGRATAGVRPNSTQEIVRKGEGRMVLPFLFAALPVFRFEYDRRRPTETRKTGFGLLPLCSGAYQKADPCAASDESRQKFKICHGSGVSWREFRETRVIKSGMTDSQSLASVMQAGSADLVKTSNNRKGCSVPGANQGHVEVNEPLMSTASRRY